MKRHRQSQQQQQRRQQQSLSSFLGKTTEAGLSNKRVRSGTTLDWSSKGGRTSRFVPCPLCQRSFPFHQITRHAANCTAEHRAVENSNSDSDSNNNNNSNNGAIGKSVDNVPTTQSKGKIESILSETLVVPSLNTATRNESGKEHAINDDIRDPPFASHRPLVPSPTEGPWWKRTKTRSSLTTQSATIDNPIHPTSEPIPGLFLYEDFLTKEEESSILSYLYDDPEGRSAWKMSRFNGEHAGQRWGVHCNLRDRRVGAAERPMPPFFLEILWPKLRRLPSMMGCCPNEGNAIEYRPGHYLTDHVDDRQLSKEPIANLSLAGDCRMTYTNTRRKDGDGNKHDDNVKEGKEQHKVLLRRRTLQVLTGRARYDYTHGIRSVDLLSPRRVSMTMRESPLTTSKQKRGIKMKKP